MQTNTTERRSSHVSGPRGPRSEWAAGMRRHTVATRAFRTRQRQVGERDVPALDLSPLVSDQLDRLAEHLVDAESSLIELPAPDLAALRWKLERLLAIEPDGTTNGWNGEHVRQTLADIARLLPA